MEGGSGPGVPEGSGVPETLPGPSGPAAGVPYPLRAIGTLESCFSQRNGTPRQPLLVPAARARLRLRCAQHCSLHLAYSACGKFDPSSEALSTGKGYLTQQVRHKVLEEDTRRKLFATFRKLH